MPLNTLPAQENLGNQTPEVRDDLAVRVREWHLRAIRSELWKEWMELSEEDMQFYIGGEKGQWGYRGNYTAYEKLVAVSRSVVTINHIAPQLRLVSGYERSNRLDPKAAPQGQEDVESAQLMSAFLKFTAEQCGAQDLLSEVFDEGNITGMEVAEVGVDYTVERRVNGEIAVERLTPGQDIIWDPHWKRYDLQDALYVLKFKWVYVLDLIEEYPEHADSIRAAVNALTDVVTGGQSSQLPGDAYGYVRGHPVENLTDEMHFYAPDEQRVLVVEPWYWVHYTTWSVFDAERGTTEIFDSQAAASEVVQSNPDRFSLHRETSKVIRSGVVIPATYHVLEEDMNRYPNDDTHYPFVPYIAERRRNVIFGIVRNLKDAQRVENRRWSQITDILARWAALRPMLQKGALLNPSTLGDASATSPIEYDPDKGAPGFWVPPIAELSRVLEALALQMKNNLKEISGFNSDLLGQRQDTASGVAIARRQQQGQVIATVYFDNFRKTRKLFYQRVAKRIQQVYTTEDYVRLTNERGEPFVLQVNPLAAKGLSDTEYRTWVQAQAGAGKPKILRDLSSLKFDVQISEAPVTPTARAAQLLGYLEVAEKIPAFGELMMDKIAAAIDVDGGAELVERAQRFMQAKGIIQAPAMAPAMNPAVLPERPGTPPGQAPQLPQPGPSAPPAPAAPPM